MAQVAEQLGTPLMPWQRGVADIALEVDPLTRRLVYRQVVLTVPRQSGKTSLILATAVQRALGFGSRQVITYSAQTRNDARKKWEDDHVEALRNSPFARLFRVRKANGNEAVIWRNGSRHGISSTTEKAGHGSTLDLAFVDEAFAQVDDRLEQAFKPAMITREQPQLWVVSTAGNRGSSLYLWDKVVDGRRHVEDGRTSGVAYFEWSAPEDADPGDPAVWRACMPALGHTVTEDAIRDDFVSMKRIEFMRAYLNMWPKRVVVDPVIPAETWATLVDEHSRIPGALVFFLDMTPAQTAGAIAAAGRRADGRMHVEVVEHRPRTGWMGERVIELVRKHNPAAVVLDPSSPAGALIPVLREAGIEPKLMTARDVAHACSAFYDAATKDALRHLNQAELNAALAGAKKRPLGHAWAWDRQDPDIDISPLVAVTGALHGFAQYGQVPEPEDVEPLCAWG
ncbi:terminase large subunit [Allokutzneria sp. A3M-2-11 16]|uniref:terminase large subunit domain-containing protein n=1 Tax=Allokutzneria sp. A3M-2-11 16 TaxID=2962043 RepID=UPI0020B8F638|nr:terminase large subunit [Allokutzneria sp. A3M-2-11 16]MCP3805384.1 terminase large subunit [Allokutzneria sp. A3M-2-11 16]